MKVTCLNEFFVRIPQKIHNNLNNIRTTDNMFQNQRRNIESLFFLPQITEKEINDMFKTLLDSTAYDNYFLSSQLIKNFKEELSYPLSVVINTKIQAGYYPEELKTSKISAIYKNAGEKSDPSNFRPIRILPVFSKFFE